MSKYYSIRKGFIANPRWLPTKFKFTYDEFVELWILGKTHKYLNFRCKNYKLFYNETLVGECTSKVLIFYFIPEIFSFLSRFTNKIKRRTSGYWYGDIKLNSKIPICINIHNSLKNETK